ncbi:hypothetical protein GCM10010230_49870 [Streptomyces narbonensis]|nr:hypothetical protein GCM10010230_49870 [Streptomyces narbonensis]
MGGSGGWLRVGVDSVEEVLREEAGSGEGRMAKAYGPARWSPLAGPYAADLLRRQLTLIWS